MLKYGLPLVKLPLARERRKDGARSLPSMQANLDQGARNSDLWECSQTSSSACAASAFNRAGKQHSNIFFVCHRHPSILSPNLNPKLL